jgi:hypothetical protein
MHCIPERTTPMEKKQWKEKCKREEDEQLTRSHLEIMEYCK